MIPGLLLGLVFLSSCGSNKDSLPVLRFSAIPDQNTTELVQKFAPLVAYLSESLGVPVEYVPSRDYQASVDMFRAGDIQLAWFGGLTGVQARAGVPGARAIVQGDVDPHYFSYFIANKSTGLEPGPDFPVGICEHAFTFGSEISSSGRLMPEFFIIKNTGKSPAEFFKRGFSFSGSHDKTLELVQGGEFPCGVVNYKVYEKRVAEGKIDPEICRVIWKTPVYSGYNFTAHPDLDVIFGSGFTDRLRDTLTGINDENLLSALPRHKLIRASNREFFGIAEVARELGMLH